MGIISRLNEIYEKFDEWTAMITDTILIKGGNFDTGHLSSSELNKITEAVRTIPTFPDISDWEITNRFSELSVLSGLYINNQYVIVGYTGDIFTSIDGFVWTKRESDTTDNLRMVIYGNNQYVIVGESQYIWTSSDGIVWTKRLSGCYFGVYSITYGNGLYVAVGWGGGIMTSSDGIIWTKREGGVGGPTDSLISIVYANNQYVIVGQSGIILTSPDGIIWTKRTSGTTELLRGVTHGNNQYVAVGNNGIILTSPNGIVWTKRTSGISSWLFYILYKNGQYTTTGQLGVILTSPDGIVWTNRVSGTSNDLFGIIYSNNQYIILGNGAILTASQSTKSNQISANSSYLDKNINLQHGSKSFPNNGWDKKKPITMNFNIWTKQNSGIVASSEGALRSILYINKQYVAVGGYGDCIIVTSPDGIVWTRRNISPRAMECVTYGSNQYVAVGWNNGIVTSTDGINWSAKIIIPEGGTVSFVGITYANNQYVVVGQNGTIITSPDAVTWTKRVSGVTAELTGIVYGNNQYVAVGHGGNIITSPDGIIWTKKTSNVSTELKRVGYFNNQFIVAGDKGVILTSPDGITWTKRTSGTNIYLIGVAYANNQYIIVGVNGVMLTSLDGIVWTTRTSGTMESFYDIVYGNNQCVAVGLNGTIITSTTTSLYLINILKHNGIYFGVSDNGIWKSMDMINWNKVCNVTRPETDMYARIFAFTGTIIAYYPGRWYYSKNEGETWKLTTTSRVNGTGIDISFGGIDIVDMIYRSRNQSNQNSTEIYIEKRSLEGPVPSSKSVLITEDETNLKVVHGNGKTCILGNKTTISYDDNIINLNTISSTITSLVSIEFYRDTFYLISPKGEVIKTKDFVKYEEFGNVLYPYTSTSIRISSCSNGMLLLGDNESAYEVPLAFDGWIVKSGLVIDAISNVNSSNIVITPPGAIWDRVSGITSDTLRTAIYVDNQYIAVGGDIAGTVLVSHNGIEWTKRSILHKAMESIVYGNNQYVAVGWNNSMATSIDGVTWVNIDIPGEVFSFTDIVYGNNQYVAVGSVGNILTSSDGILWTKRVSNTTAILYGITYGNNQYIAVGNSGTILTSPDGITWTKRDSGSIIDGFTDIVYGNNQYVVVGDSSTILTSPDGIVWTKRDSEINQIFWGVIYENDQYIAVGNGGSISTSPDGITWTKRNSGVVSALRGIIYVNNQYIIVGANGTILESSPKLYLKSPENPDNKTLIPTSQKDIQQITSSITKIPLTFTADKVFINIIGENVGYKKYGDITLSRNNHINFLNKSINTIKITNNSANGITEYIDAESIGKITDDGFEIYDYESQLTGVYFEYHAIGNRYTDK